MKDPLIDRSQVLGIYPAPETIANCRTICDCFPSAYLQSSNQVLLPELCPPIANYPKASKSIWITSYLGASVSCKHPTLFRIYRRRAQMRVSPKTALFRGTHFLDIHSRAKGQFHISSASTKIRSVTQLSHFPTYHSSQDRRRLC